MFSNDLIFNNNGEVEKYEDPIFNIQNKKIEEALDNGASPEYIEKIFKMNDYIHKERQPENIKKKKQLFSMFKAKNNIYGYNHKIKDLGVSFVNIQPRAPKLDIRRKHNINNSKRTNLFINKNKIFNLEKNKPVISRSDIYNRFKIGKGLGSGMVLEGK